MIDEHLREMVRINGEGSKAIAIVRVSSVLKSLALSELECSRLLIVTAELVQNVITHGGGQGVLTLHVREESGVGEIHIDVKDQGEGIADVDKALLPEFSTAGTLGLGLPGVKRMVDTLEIESKAGEGTHVHVVHRFGAVSRRIGSNPVGSVEVRSHGLPAGTSVLETPAQSPAAVPAEARWEALCGSATRPRPGLVHCGDQALCLVRDDVVLLALADGTGHGADAEEAATRAVEEIAAAPLLPLQGLFGAVERRLRGTVGTALSIVRLDRNSGVVEAAGIGNVSVLFLQDAPEPDGNSVTLREGIVGVGRPRTPWVKTLPPLGARTVVLASDGITIRDRRGLPPIVRAVSDPAGVARRLVQERGRSHDDAGCVVGLLRPLEMT